MKQPENLANAIIYFSDPERAFVYAVNLRWPDKNVSCPRCGHDEHYFIKTRLLWKCKGCNRQFTVKVGTIFEDSALGLDKWMTAVWMLVNCKNGISSHELARSLGITQKSAWFMLQRIREALQQQNISKIGGPGGVEADETYIGARAKNMHKDRKLKIQQERSKLTNNAARQSSPGSLPNKTPVFGLMDRDTRTIRTKVLPYIKRDMLQSEILKQVTKGSPIFTDESMVYKGLAEKEFVHEIVNHMQEYVRGEVHTNCLENYWSLLKRSLKGTYVAVEPFHLGKYVDEQTFRFNNRKDVSDRQRFAMAMNLISGKRLTYNELTGKDLSPRHETPRAGQAEQEPF
jgi:transposase-like protein